MADYEIAHAIVRVADAMDRFVTAYRERTVLENRKFDLKLRKWEKIEQDK